MPLSAVALVVCAALLHALWNIAAKKAAGGAPMVLLSALMIVVLWAPLGAWAAWDALPAWGAREWGLVLLSGLTHLAYFHVLLRGYAASDLTVVYPVARGTGPLISALGAVLLMGEVLSPVGGLGILAVTGGVFLVAGGPALFGGSPERRQRVHQGVAWGAATGVLIAAYTLIDGYAVKVALISPILVDYVGNLLRIPFMLPAALRDREGCLAAWRRQWRYALFIAALSPAGYILVLYAARIAPISHVAPAREVSMLFAALLGGRLLGEGDRGWRIAGAACIAVGVVGLALG